VPQLPAILAINGSSSNTHARSWFVNWKSERLREESAESRIERPQTATHRDRCRSVAVFDPLSPPQHVRIGRPNLFC
jgi:hypothetical protein